MIPGSWIPCGIKIWLPNRKCKQQDAYENKIPEYWNIGQARLLCVLHSAQICVIFSMPHHLVLVNYIVLIDSVNQALYYKKIDSQAFRYYQHRRNKYKKCTYVQITWREIKSINALCVSHLCRCPDSPCILSIIVKIVIQFLELVFCLTVSHRDNMCPVRKCGI